MGGGYPRSVSYAAHRAGGIEAYERDLSKGRNLYDSNPETKPTMFVSFQHDDVNQLELFRHQAENSDKLAFNDSSFQKKVKKSEWKQVAYNRIKNSDGVIVMVGEKTYKSEAVEYEIETAHELEKPVIGMRVNSSEDHKIPPAMREHGDKTVKWKLDTVQHEIDEKITYGEAA